MKDHKRIDTEYEIIEQYFNKIADNPKFWIEQAQRNNLLRIGLCQLLIGSGYHFWGDLKSIDKIRKEIIEIENAKLK